MIRSLCVNQVRGLSTKIQRTPEQIKAIAEQTEKIRQTNLHSGKKKYFNFILMKDPNDFFISSVSPKVITMALGSGKELHVPKNITEIAALSGMPADQANRTVVIAQRMLKSLQSGQRMSHQWQIYWKNTERWSNPLMGWTSTADPMSNVKV